MYDVDLPWQSAAATGGVRGRVFAETAFAKRAVLFQLVAIGLEFLSKRL